MNEGPFTQLPPNLPVPANDGACEHLTGKGLPDLALLSTTPGHWVNLASLPGLTVIYAYPLSGRPGVQLPAGWDQIPGARGCTPESCSFRDLHHEMQSLGATIFGLSAQDSDYQREFKERMHLPFDLLSDEKFELANALNLPTFTVQGQRLIKRLTLICSGGQIERVFYPVFPPDGHGLEVLNYLRRRFENAGAISKSI